MSPRQRPPERLDDPASPQLGAFGLPEPTDPDVLRRRDEELRSYYALLSELREPPSIVVERIFRICRTHAPLQTVRQRMNAELMSAQLRWRSANDLIAMEAEPRFRNAEHLPEPKIQHMLRSEIDQIHRKYDALLAGDEEE